MKRDYKSKMLQIISSNLEMFYPNLKGFFICPTCLKKISINEVNLISEAHIIPKSVGGKLITFLCCDCNSLFGTKQDKWFGDVIDTKFISPKSLLYTAYKKTYFIIDGLKVNGRWEANKEGKLCFIILKNRNSPEVNLLIHEKFS